MTLVDRVQREPLFVEALDAIEIRLDQRAAGQLLLPHRRMNLGVGRLDDIERRGAGTCGGLGGCRGSHRPGEQQNRYRPTHDGGSLFRNPCALVNDHALTLAGQTPARQPVCRSTTDYIRNHVTARDETGPGWAV